MGKREGNINVVILAFLTILFVLIACIGYLAFRFVSNTTRDFSSILSDLRLDGVQVYTTKSTVTLTDFHGKLLTSQSIAIPATKQPDNADGDVTVIVGSNSIKLQDSLKQVVFQHALVDAGRISVTSSYEGPDPASGGSVTESNSSSFFVSGAVSNAKSYTLDIVGDSRSHGL